MKKKKSGKKVKSWTILSPQPKAAPPSWQGNGWIVLIDQAPLRKKASVRYRKITASLEAVRQERDRFYQEDKPAFEQWEASTFGPMLTQVRENDLALMQKSRLIEEVRQEMFFAGARSYRAAYESVMKRKANPAPPTGPKPGGPFSGSSGFKPGGKTEPTHDHSDDSRSERSPEDEERALFEELIGAAMGLDPKKLHPKQYEKMFREFREHVLGKKKEPAPLSRPAKTREAKSKEARMKEIYRVLVRRLHPDAVGDAKAKVSHLWHEVQQAYQQGNLDRLEVLLALTEMESAADLEQVSLSQMREVVASLQRDLDALKRNLKEVQRNIAWNFSRLPDRSKLAARIRVELERDLADQKAELAQADKLLADWSSSAGKKKAASKAEPPKEGKARVKEIPKPSQRGYQAEFGF